MGLVITGRVMIFNPEKFYGCLCWVSCEEGESAPLSESVRTDLSRFDGDAVILKGEIREAGQERWIIADGALVKLSDSVAAAIWGIFLSAESYQTLESSLC
jgi:hypothetical protein